MISVPTGEVGILCQFQINFHFVFADVASFQYNKLCSLSVKQILTHKYINVYKGYFRAARTGMSEMVYIDPVLALVYKDVSLSLYTALKGMALLIKQIYLIQYILGLSAYCDL